MRRVLPLGTLIPACLSVLTFATVVLTDPTGGTAESLSASDRATPSPFQIPGITFDDPMAASTASLTRSDHIAALEAIHIGLTETADGATFSWRRQRGRLSGTVHPTQSFEDRRGLVCRHVVIALNAARLARRVEGIACRDAGGIWWLEG